MSNPKFGRRVAAFFASVAVACHLLGGTAEAVSAITAPTAVLTGVGQCATVSMGDEGFNSIYLSISGTFVGTLSAQTPGGSAVTMYAHAGGGSQTTVVGAGATFFEAFMVPGSLPSVNVCMTAYTSGSVTIAMRATTAVPPFSVTQLDGSGFPKIDCANGCSAPYGTASNQTGLANSFVGVSGYNGTNGVTPLLQDLNGYLYMRPQLQGSSGVTTPTLCDKAAPISTSASGLAQIVAASGSTVIRICGFNVMAAGTTTFTLSGGTGTNCGTTNVAITGGYQLITQTGLASFASQPINFTAAGQELCINNSAAVAIAGFVNYEQS